MEEFRNLIITEPNAQGDGITINGPDTPAENEVIVVENCVIDFSNVERNKMDENISFVRGVQSVVKNCVFTDGIKLALCGNGDYPLEDRNARIKFENCVFKNFGRRAPEAQDGANVTLYKCVVWNWGVSKYFDVRSFASYAHDGGSITLDKCVFIQDRFWQHSPLTMLKDIANHIGNDWNNRCLSYKSFIPGVMRGAIALNSGRMHTYKVYKNKRWIKIDDYDSRYDLMSRYDAKCVITETFKLCGLEDKIPEALSKL